MDLQINREIIYGEAISDFPNPKVGDRIYITDNGESTGKVLEKWEWRGNHWIDVVDVSEGASSGSTGVLGKDFVLNIGPGKSFGKYEDGDTIEAEGKTLEEFFDDVFTEQIPPVYVYPQATLTSVNPKFEVGQVVDIELIANFIQNDAGNFTAVQIQKNSLPISTSSTYLDENVTVPPVGTPIQYRARYDYAQGPIKDDNLGEPYPTGRIPDGFVLSNIISIVGYKKFFWGAMEEIEGKESIDVRGSGSNQFEDENNRQFVINTGTTNKGFWFWVPAEYELQEVIDLDALNVNLNSEYQDFTLTVLNGGGGNIAGTVYIMETDNPYKTNHRHQIKIKLI